MKFRIVAGLLLFAACGGSSQQMHPVQARAPFDLGCTAADMRYLQIDSKTVGAQGCGKRATYVKVCRRINSWGQDECQWVMDSASN